MIVGALTLVSTAGGLITANSAVSDPANGQNLGICHRTNSNKNPYVSESPNINATGLHGGHINHTGPIWDPTLKGQGIKWGDIIPPFQYTDKNGVTQDFGGLNYTAEGRQILDNGCAIPNSVLPESPTVTQSVCNSDHNATVPTIDLPTTPGITYTTDPAAPYTAGEDVTVTATAAAPGNWFLFETLPDGWTIDPDNPAVATFVVHLDAAPTDCKTPIVPETPTIVESVCTGDPAVPTVPTITLQTTAGITYTVDKNPPYTGGEVVKVTAHISDSAFTFVTAPGDWVRVDANTETLVITLDDTPDCTAPATGVTPLAPEFTQPTCVGSPSQLVAPTLTLPVGPAGVTYMASAASPYAGSQSVTLTATADGTHEFSSPGLNGWTFVDAHHETFVVAFDANPTCSGELAGTGVDSRQLIEIGGIVLLFGLGMQFLSMGMRRRPTA